jgi:hypothetical protein
LIVKAGCKTLVKTTTTILHSFRPRSAPCLTACCTTETCSSAARGAAHQNRLASIGGGRIEQFSPRRLPPLAGFKMINEAQMLSTGPISRRTFLHQRAGAVLGLAFQLSLPRILSTGLPRVDRSKRLSSLEPAQRKNTGTGSHSSLENDHLMPCTGQFLAGGKAGQTSPRPLAIRQRRLLRGPLRAAGTVPIDRLQRLRRSYSQATIRTIVPLLPLTWSMMPPI